MSTVLGGTSDIRRIYYRIEDVFPIRNGDFPFSHVSNEKNPGCLGYIGNCTTQLCGDYDKPL